MEVVNTLDIDGTQWEMQDVGARNRIAELENSLVPQSLGDINIELKPGYTAAEARMIFHYKVGKIHFMRVILRNISGKDIGTDVTAHMGSINIFPKNETSFMLHDYVNSAVLRCYLNYDGTVSIGESKGVEQGNNNCLGELIFAEA